MSGATISMSLSDYEALKDQLREANERAAKHASLADAALAGKLPADAVDLRDLIRQSIPAMAHAVANLGPEISSWPVDGLRAWAALLDAITGVNDSATQEQAIDLKAFANECEKAQRLRGR